MKQKISNWNNYPVVDSNVKSFSFPSQLQQLHNEMPTYMVRGNGRCYGDSSLSDNIISTLNYDKVISFDTIKGVFECESGLTLDQVLEIIVPKGWFLPVTPGTKFITVGGAIASDVHGKNHHADGSFSNHILEMDILVADGTSKTCGPDQNEDLFSATCGGMGLTGIITNAKFSLKKIETSFIKQKQIRADNLEELLQLFQKYNLYTYSVAWIDCLKKGKNFGRSILILGEHALIDDLSGDQRKNPLVLPRKKQISFPFNLPSWILNTFTVKAFNFLYYNKNYKKEIDNVVSYEPFFYPLDAILHWNRGYGKKGFIQYQFVLPLESKNGLIEILKRISDKGVGSFLSVLKVFGKQDSLISFPMEGYTLALDIPIFNGLFDFLDELDKVVLQYSGRLYMSKDARMKPEILEAGYPKLSLFKNIVEKYNTNGKIRSFQSHRLKLTN